MIKRGPMLKKTIIASALLAIAGCQLTTVTDQKKAQAACAAVEETSGCFELAYQNLRDVRMQKRATAGTRIVLSPSPRMRHVRDDDANTQ